MTDPDLIGTHTHQVIDLPASFRPITKFTAELSASNAAASEHTDSRRIREILRGKKKPVICITGDAGIAMVMGELGLLRRHHPACPGIGQAHTD